MNVARTVATLRRMTVAELRQEYARAFGEETRSRHKEHLVRRIAWRLQANVEGGLSERARRRAEELAADSDVRLTAPRAVPAPTGGRTTTHAVSLARNDRLPMPGTILTRTYKGRDIQVRVLPGGFEYEGEVYRSLTAVVRQVTGTHWNGYHFFRLGRKGNRGHGA